MGDDQVLRIWRRDRFVIAVGAYYNFLRQWLLQVS